MKFVEKQIMRWQATQKNNYQEALIKLNESGLLELADNEFLIINNRLKDFSNEERRALLTLALKHVSMKMIREGNKKEDVNKLCNLIINNWLMIIEKEDIITPSLLYEKSVYEWERVGSKLKERAIEEKNERKKIKKICAGTLKLFTGGSFVITDTLSMMASGALIGYLMVSVCSGALIFYNGIDDFIDL